MKKALVIYYKLNQFQILKFFQHVKNIGKNFIRSKVLNYFQSKHLAEGCG